MKSFRQFMEQPEIVNLMRNFAIKNKKSPEQLTQMRDKITGGVISTLGKKMDLKGLVNKIPDSKEMSDKIGKVQGKFSQKLKDPKTSQQFNKIFDMIDTLNK